MKSRGRTSENTPKTIKLTGISVSDKLEAFCSEQEYFRGLSFPTISSDSIWTAQVLLASTDAMKLGYVSRSHPRDHFNHVILSVQGYKPKEFAMQINLNTSNMWGIVKSIVDLCLKLNEGKYVTEIAYIAGRTPNRWGFTIDGEDVNSLLEPFSDSLREEQASPLVTDDMETMNAGDGKLLWKKQTHPLYCCVTLSLLAEIINSRLLTCWLGVSMDSINYRCYSMPRRHPRGRDSAAHRILKKEDRVIMNTRWQSILNLKTALPMIPDFKELS